MGMLGGGGGFLDQNENGREGFIFLWAWGVFTATDTRPGRRHSHTALRSWRSRTRTGHAIPVNGGNVEPMMVWGWYTVCNAGPTYKPALAQHIVFAVVDFQIRQLGDESQMYYQSLK